MSKSCLWRPSKGNTTFSRLKPQIGYEKAWKVIGVASNDRFIAKYKESLSFDAEGFPTYQSLLDNDYIQKNVIGLQDVAKIKSRSFPEVEDTLKNYGNLLEEALRYNRENTDSNFIAIVEYSGDKIKINLVEKNTDTIDSFKKQYAVYLLNQRLGNLLAPLGITPTMLAQEEVKAGRAGSTQFIAAMGMANSAAALIKIANNMEGSIALTEEFSHVLIDALHDSPLVQRAINAISDGPVLSEILGDEFDDLMDFYDGDIDMVAEEAVGQILRDKLVEGTMVQIGDDFQLAPNRELPSQVEGIFQRLKNFIKNLFKKISYRDVVDSIQEANGLMATLSEDLLSEKTKIQRNRINSRNRNAIFNSLSDRIDRNIKVLKEAIETETKRSKLLHEDITLGKKRIAEIEKYTRDRNNTALGVMIYANKGLKMLRGAQDNLNNFELLSFEDQVKTLRNTKTILHSLGNFIATFNEILNDEEGRDDNLFEGTFTVGGATIEAGELLKDLNNLVERITAQYATTAPPIFVKFLKDSLGEEVIDLLLKHNGNATTVEELLQHSGHDISFMDLWLDAMRDSSNPILQAYDKVVKNANDRARLKAVSMFKEIQALRQQAEAEGITDFEFMFEKDKNGHKSGNYVNPNYNWAEYYRQRKIFEKSLEEKYGENPAGDKKKERNKERREWLEQNTTLNNTLDRVPKADKFPPTKLTSAQQNVLNSFLEYKKKIDALYPENRVNTFKAVQARKDNIQRLLDGGINPVTMYKNWKEDLASTYLDRSDDDQIFGEATSGLTNFDGTEYMRLPVLYANRLKNPDELSTDVFGSLYAYAAAATKYEQMEKVVAPLELGRDIIEGKVSDKTKMKVEESRGQKKVVETINHLGQKIKRPAIMSDRSNIFEKLDTFLETQVYQRYLKDEGTFEVFGAKVKTAKVTSRLLQMGSVAQLGFNFLANLANVTTGIAMQNIEVAAGQYFTAKELAYADKEFAKLMWSETGEFYARNKSSKLALFDELFDVRQNFGNAKHHTERSNLLRRIFGRNIQFIGQEAGDNWLYNRTAIAMCKHIKVKYKNQETTLWDVLDIREHPDTHVKEMYVPDGVVDMLGNAIDKKRIGQISRRIAAVNHRLFGIYNEEDMNAANRVSLGRILMQYRKWMKPQFNARFEAKRTDLDLGEEIEGYYRTSARLAKEVLQELKRGEFQYTVWKDNLSDMEKANIKRTITELTQFAALVFLVGFCLGGGDDDELTVTANFFADKYGTPGLKKSGDHYVVKDEPYLLKLARYVGNRLIHETGNLAPSYTMVSELVKTVSNPAAILGPMQDSANFIGSLLNPTQWNDELKSGDYEGHSHLYKNTMKLPVPVLAHIRQFNRAYNGLDKSIQFYTNPDIK